MSCRTIPNLSSSPKRHSHWQTAFPLHFPRSYTSNSSSRKSQDVADSGNKDRPSSPSSSKDYSPRDLPSSTESRRSQLNQRFSHVMDTLQTRLLTASQTLNDITGYSSIENIKNENAELEIRLADAHDRVRTARQAYKTSNTKRSSTQREVTTLLARKDTWSPQDLERFTELYRTDHVLEGEVSSAQEALTEAERDEQDLSQKLNAGMLKRYHEEQIWSDRIRRASTWGTWGLMGMNFLLFVVLQFVAEPWKRRRLVRGVVAEGKMVLEEVRNELQAVQAALNSLPTVGDAATMEDTAFSAPSSLAVSDPPTLESAESSIPWRAVFEEGPQGLQTLAKDLTSERMISLRVRDASILALQGAAAGVVIAGSIAMVLLRR